MGLFFEGMECSLCGKPMNEGDQLFGTSHFLGPDSDLWKYSDAVLHWDCYAKWEHRPRFARMYFEASGGWGKNNPYWGTAYEDENVRVTINPDRLVGEIDVMLAATGSQHRVHVRDWEDWLNGEWFEQSNHEVERDALAAVIPLLRSRFSTVEEIKSAAGMADKPTQRLETESPMVARISYEFAFRDLAQRALTKGIACPHCGEFSQDYECFQAEQVSEDGPQSHLKCVQCGKELGPLDVE